MPTLILPPWITPDTDAIFAAAQAAGWKALRLNRWRSAAGLNGRDVVLYGEPLFADAVAPSLGVALLQARRITRSTGSLLKSWMPSTTQSALRSKSSRPIRARRMAADGGADLGRHLP
jgi:hypothetical protein